MHEILTMKQLCLLFLAILIFSCKETSTEPMVQAENQTSADPNVGCTDQMATNYKSTAKTDDCSCKYDFNSTLSTDVPTDFTQKILIEEHSGTWCGWCPLSKETLERLAINPNIVGVEIHYNDKLTLLDEIYVPLKNVYGHPAWPSGMINRKKNINGSTFIIGEPDWEKNTTAILANPKTDIGIALDTKIVGEEVVILTKTKFNKAGSAEKYGIGIYLVEDKVEKYPQINYARGMPQFIKYQAYTLPALIEDIKHYNVARGVIAPHVGGHSIPEAASKKLAVYNKLFNYKITNKEIKLTNCKIIAFVMNEKNEIQNVNYCQLGNKTNWN